MSAEAQLRQQIAPLQSRLDLGAYTSAVPCARAHTTAVLHEWGLPHLTDDAELIVSELVTNAVEASADGLAAHVSLRLAADNAHLRIEVWDGSPRLPAPEPHAIDSDSGRGFELVSMLASNIGVIPDHDRGGKTVWALVTHGQAPHT